jgi:lipid A ethanolaminephosphotransferase
MKFLRNLRLTAPVLAVLCATFMVAADNRFFWRAFLEHVHIATPDGFFFAASVFFILVGIFSVMLLALSARLIFKPVLILMLLLSALVGYFQTEYGVIIDKGMIQNVMETDFREASELLSFPLGVHMALFGLLPALFVGAVRIRYRPWLQESFMRLLALLGMVLITGLLIWVNYKDFVIVGRAHRELRTFINPTSPMFEAYKYARRKLFDPAQGSIQPIGLDARQGSRYLHAAQSAAHKTVVVLVVGETARAANFSLNGYARETNPKLARDGVISFRNAYACGTSTAESIPCIFSHFDRKDYSPSSAARHENVLDVLARAGVKVLWRDNNSGCKGVCMRVAFENENTLARKDQCSASECYDELLLNGLRERIEASDSDILIVLHQKGSHGPAYYERHPPEFSRFIPECKDHAPQNCSREALRNAYDNTILYTDHVLHLTIETLKSLPERYASVMLYVSDHGESLGENGIYLHGLPYLLAPDEQRHIPMILWLSDTYARTHGIDRECMAQRAVEEASHDHVSHSLLGLFGVETRIYLPDHDLLSGCRAG